MSFVKQFDPTKKEHVEWLQKIDVSMSKATNQEKYGSVDFMKIVNDNPFGIKMTNPMEWAESHFQLCMKFTQAVFRGVAHIPTQRATD
tara:strand:- start:217 stop:480 length:264 start_codon:yes stop_codon:yes gene_type:complete